jgi:tetratricopeptide (TPR) repeat protein
MKKKILSRLLTHIVIPVCALAVIFQLTTGCGNPQNTTSESVDTLNEEHVSALAARIVFAGHNGDAETFNKAINKAYIREQVSENSIVNSGFDVEGGEAFFDKCLQVGEQAVRAINNGGDFTFVRYYQQDGEHHVVFRTYDNFTLNFSDYIVDTVGGKLMLHDGFIYNLGCMLSTSVQYSMLYNLMLQTNPESDVKWLQQAEEQTLKHKNKAALKTLTEHKDALKEYPLFYQLYIANLYQTDAKNFIARIDELQPEGVDERYLLLHKLLFHVNNGHLAETENTINQLISHTGDDPIYLLFYGKANMEAKKYQDALTVFQMAEDGLPLIWDLWYSELQCYARLKDKAGYEKCLAKGKEAYGMSEEELRNLKVR